MIQKQRNLLDAKMKNALVKCFEEKKVSTFLSFILKFWVVKTDTENENLTNTTWSAMTKSVGNNENLNDFGTTVI
jgi:hypothetical protein